MKDIGRKKRSKADPTATMKDGDNFGMIYASLLRSKAFNRLSMPAKQLYVTLRVHANTKECRACMYKHAEAEGHENMYYPETCFVFPGKQAAAYGYTDRSNTGKYMKELERAGFIRKYENNSHRWKVTIYQFSGDWKLKDGGMTYHNVDKNVVCHTT